MSDKDNDAPGAYPAGKTPGVRKDGLPFKEGNTREDGSYENGKYRAPVHGQFRKGDNRPRGKRQKGSKNTSTIWAKRLSHKRTIEGETMTSQEWLIEAMIRRGITKSDRAAELVLTAAEKLERSSERKLSVTDEELLAMWADQLFAKRGSEVLDDSDLGNEGADGEDQE